MSPIRKLLVSLAVCCVAIIGFAMPAMGTSVHITSGNGTHAHPYQFKVIKNKNGVVVYQITRWYHTSVGDTFEIVSQTTTSNTTHEHVSGDRSDSKMYTRYKFRCFGQSTDVSKPCQEVHFWPFSRIGDNIKYATPVDCKATSSNYCFATGWVTRYGWKWNVDGGLWADDYKFPVWQAAVTVLHVKIAGHWIKRDGSSVVMPWVQATLHT